MVVKYSEMSFSEGFKELPPRNHLRLRGRMDRQTDRQGRRMMVGVSAARPAAPRRSVNGPIHQTGRLIPLSPSLAARYLTLLFSKVLNFLDCRCGAAADEEMVPEGHVYRTYLPVDMERLQQVSGEMSLNAAAAAVNTVE